MKNYVQSIMTRALGYFLKTSSVVDLICSFVDHGNIFLISAANVLIQSEKNLENVAGETSNIVKMSSTSNPRHNCIKILLKIPLCKLIFLSFQT